MHCLSPNDAHIRAPSFRTIAGQHHRSIYSLPRVPALRSPLLSVRRRDFAHGFETQFFRKLNAHKNRYDPSKLDRSAPPYLVQDAGIGTSIDSFYEYLLKSHLLLGGDETLHMFQEAYAAVQRHLHQPPWYLEVNMDDGMLVWPLFNSLQAFWPGLQVSLKSAPFYSRLCL